MRLEPVQPAAMTDVQRELHEEMSAAIAEKLHGFVSEQDGALIGPFAPMLRWPQWGAGFWAQTRALLATTVLPKPAHEVAVLVTGAHFRTRYEIYAHERVADGIGLPKSWIATIVAGQRPGDLGASEGAAYDLAAALVRGGPVPDSTYAAAQVAFGAEGAAEIVFLVAGYAAVSVILDGFAMPVPDADV